MEYPAIPCGYEAVQQPFDQLECERFAERLQFLGQSSAMTLSESGSRSAFSPSLRCLIFIRASSCSAFSFVGKEIPAALPAEVPVDAAVAIHLPADSG
jgi:hypothetical protein